MMIPLSNISAESSGGVRSNAFFTASTIMLTGSFNACRTSSEVTSIVFGIPDTRSLPLTDIVSLFMRMAEPTDFLIASPVDIPISSLCSFRNHWTNASSISSPATRIVSFVTTPDNAITAISVVPPPISTIILPIGCEMSRPMPIAAATGSSIRNTSLALARKPESFTARLSTSVTPEGTHITIRILAKGLIFIIRIKPRSMPSVISKSAITPSRRGRIVSMSR